MLLRFFDNSGSLDVRQSLRFTVQTADVVGLADIECRTGNCGELPWMYTASPDV